jgi:hypothetical protein
VGLFVLKAADDGFAGNAPHRRQDREFDLAAG